MQWNVFVNVFKNNYKMNNLKINKAINKHTTSQSLDTPITSFTIAHILAKFWWLNHIFAHLMWKLNGMIILNSL